MAAWFCGQFSAVAAPHVFRDKAAKSRLKIFKYSNKNDESFFANCPI